MSAVETASTCSCGTIGAPKELRQCEEHHTYWLGDLRLTSVSKVIGSVLPSDYALVNPTVLANASTKGRCIDVYFSDWSMLNTSVCSLEEFREKIEPLFYKDDPFRSPKEHAEDAMHRLEMLIEWWEAKGLKAKATQHIFFSEKDGTAGAADVTTESTVFDLKCVSSLQPNYALQLGSYLHMDSQQFPLRDAAIIHVQKERVKLVPYDSKKIKKQWQAALSWYQARQELTGM